MGLKVVFAASEAAPLAKTGGLADVAGALPRALKRLGSEVSSFLPFYREVALSGAATEPTGVKVEIPLGVRTITAEVFRTKGAGVTTYLIKRDEFYDRTYLYGTPEGDYFDNLERYGFFSRSVIEAVKGLGLKPDIIHTNDWQTGLIPAYLKDLYKSDKRFSKTASVFTIHNAAYQGLFPAALYGELGIGRALFVSEGLEAWGKLNLLKAGAAFADIITTVSPGYSVELQTPEYGCGLDGLFKKRSGALFGVLNGVDYGQWNPETDPLIPANYCPADMSGKSKCRMELLKRFGLKTGRGAPVMGMVSRIAEQKGFDILIEAIPRIMKMDTGVVILGSGDKKYEKLLGGLAKKYPGRLGVQMGFDDKLAHLIEAGSDIFLMPSRYEPCGLNQIYSLKYGTVPVVRATGGLKDTVREFPSPRATGFKFKEYSSEALAGKVKEALTLFQDKKKWKALQASAMAEDFSWESSARKYIELYKAAIKNRRSKGAHAG
ncbi:MAG: glycogen synthase GlgA [Thermodesulfobacteriota bacterium]